MRLVADSNLALLEETFGKHGRLTLIEGREIRREHLADADVLLLRSVTRADADLLEGTPVRFVGTATIGIDHLDTPWLEQRGITWASAPGCNADAAAQFSLAMIWEACRRLGKDPCSQSVGIIGGGNVGSRLRLLLEAASIPHVVCDPPLADLGQCGLVSYEDALAQPLVSFHVPLTRNGHYPTYRMLDAEHLQLIPDRALVINTARGDVIHGPALKTELISGRLHAALDVWPGEPCVDPELLAITTVATPHVAGYSFEGKQHGTWMIYQAFCRWLDIQIPEDPPLVSPVSNIRIDPLQPSLDQALQAACDVAGDDYRMRAEFSRLPDNPEGAFDRLRKNYPLRHDFSAWEINGASPVDASSLRSMGFRIATGDSK